MTVEVAHVVHLQTFHFSLSFFFIDSTLSATEIGKQYLLNLLAFKTFIYLLIL